MRPGWETELAPCLFARSEACRALTYLSPGVAERVVDAPGAARVKCVWGGVKVWERRGTASGERGARAESNPRGGFRRPGGDANRRRVRVQAHVRGRGARGAVRGGGPSD